MSTQSLNIWVLHGSLGQESLYLCTFIFFSSPDLQWTWSGLQWPLSLRQELLWGVLSTSGAFIHGPDSTFDNIVSLCRTSAPKMRTVEGMDAAGTSEPLPILGSSATARRDTLVLGAAREAIARLRSCKRGSIQSGTWARSWPSTGGSWKKPRRWRWCCGWTEHPGQPWDGDQRAWLRLVRSSQCWPTRSRWQGRSTLGNLLSFLTRKHRHRCSQGRGEQRRWRRGWQHPSMSESPMSPPASAPAEARERLKQKRRWKGGFGRASSTGEDSRKPLPHRSIQSLARERGFRRGSTDLLHLRSVPRAGDLPGRQYTKVGFNNWLIEGDVYFQSNAKWMCNMARSVWHGMYYVS